MDSKDNIKPKKSFGQNFLKDKSILSRIASASLSLRGNKETLVLELGAGLGALTQELLRQGAELSAVERDRDLIPILNRDFKTDIDSKKLILHEADAVKFLASIKDSNKDKIVICGNLPYHLTSSILFETAELFSEIFGAVYLIQKEVADKIAGQPHSKNYGLLSVLMQSRFQVNILEDVDRLSFWPPPKVTSSVIRFKSKSINKIDKEVSFSKLVYVTKLAFSKRRKKITNSLSEIEGIEVILDQLEIDKNYRAEDLSFQDFERISKAI